jgi:hypothetical protein
MPGFTVWITGPKEEAQRLSQELTGALREQGRLAVALDSWEILDSADHEPVGTRELDRMARLARRLAESGVAVVVAAPAPLDQGTGHHATPWEPVDREEDEKTVEILAAQGATAALAALREKGLLPEEGERILSVALPYRFVSLLDAAARRGGLDSAEAFLAQVALEAASHLQTRESPWPPDGEESSAHADQEGEEAVLRRLRDLGYID